MLDLKPCPFCGGEAAVYLAPDNMAKHIMCFGVACEKCHIMIGTVSEGKTDFYRSAMDAAAAWNRRCDNG